MYSMGITLSEIEMRINILKCSDMGTYEFMKEYYRIEERINKATQTGIITIEQGRRLENLLNM